MRTRLLIGAIILSVVFGSLHAFSVLTLSLQSAFGSSRASVSLGYSLAILTLTAGVYVAPLVMRPLSPSALAIVSAAVAAAGLALAGTGLGLTCFLIGYGLLFGFANGLAYMLFLDRGGASLAHHRGLGIGLVTATYGAGAALSAPALGLIIGASSVLTALEIQAGVTILCGLIAAWLFAGSAFPKAEAASPRHVPRRWLLAMWATYLFGALACLMIVAHTAPMMISLSPQTTLSSLAVILVALGNVAGSLAGGSWAQHDSRGYGLAIPIGIAAVAIVLLAVVSNPILFLAALAGVGFAYGALIAAVPVVVVNRVGTQSFAYAFGRIFSAWGLAGLIGPTLAGRLFDQAGNYNGALLMALSSATIGLVLALLTRHASNRQGT